MSIKKEKIPIVRFRDFSEPWIKNQLSEVAEFSKGRGYSKKDLQSHGTPIILYGRLYTNYESVISNVETYANLEENSVVSEGGEVIIPASGESADDISRASCVIERGIILGGDLNIVRPHEYLNSLFIAITLSNGSQQRELSKRAQGKSVVHLHNSDLKSVKLFYPSYEEQTAISSLFRTLDELLASYKDNLANYQSLKATMLSKMFPTAGQYAPEIRLDGFEGEWEKLKLREVVHTNPKSELPENFKYIDLESVVGTRINKIREERKESAPSRAQRLAKKGDVFYQTVRPYQKNNYLFKLDEIDYVFSTGYAQLRPIFKRCDSDFLLILLQNNRFLSKVLDRCTGTSYPAINVNDLIEILIAIPSYEEQQAIGTYFSNLDNLINSYQEKISQIETLKKKLLQDMFI